MPFNIKEVHGPPTPMRAACFLAKQLSHDCVGRDTASNGIAMLAIVGIDVVTRLQTGTETDNRRLFAEIEMAITTNARFGVHLSRLFFKLANQYHLVVVVEQGIAVFIPWY